MQLALTEPQEEFVFSVAPYPGMVAGLGAGKTQAGIVRLILKMISNRGINCAYYMPTYDLLRLRAFPCAEEICEKLGLTTKSNKSGSFTLDIIGYGTIIFRSYDRPERIVAYEVAHSILDELDTLPKDKASLVWRKVSERNRQNCKTFNTIGNVTTPDQGLAGFTYSRWGKEDNPLYHLIKADTASNPYLPDGYIEQIRENYDPMLAEMYLKGEFVSLSRNKVYHYFERQKHHSTRVLKPSDMVIHIGLDFNVGGTCATVWVIENNMPVAVDEFVSQHTQDFISRADKYRSAENRVIVYPDASGDSSRTNSSMSDIQIIRAAGYPVDAPSANPEIRDRVNAVNSLFSHNKAFINTDKCPRLTAGLESQGYDKKGAPEKFSEHPALDDWNDSMGYFLHRKFPIVRPMTKLAMVGI